MRIKMIISFDLCDYHQYPPKFKTHAKDFFLVLVAIPGSSSSRMDVLLLLILLEDGDIVPSSFLSFIDALRRNDILKDPNYSISKVSMWCEME
jgi:hypothetical protein